MQQDVFIILGSPNSPKGILSDISKTRLNWCIENYRKGNLILCTGGWGAHFNTAEKPAKLSIESHHYSTRTTYNTTEN